VHVATEDQYSRILPERVPAVQSRPGRSDGPTHCNHFSWPGYSGAAGHHRAFGDGPARARIAAARDACRHYLFDAEELAARCPAICRHALFPTSVFGHFQKEGFTGHIAGAPCRQLETPKVASGQLPWTLACEVAEHAAGFDVHIEAISFRALRAEADWEEQFNTVLQDALVTQ
jgi:hypothetical protein